MLDLLELSRNGAVFIAAILLLRLLLQKYLPRTAFVVLWLAAVARLLCPARLPSPVSIWRLLLRPEGKGADGVIFARRSFGGAADLPVQAALPDVCDLLTKVWLTGAALLLLGIAALYLGGLREARRATRLDCGAYLCRGLDSPRLCGIVRPRILLPEDVEEGLLPYILLHERIHLRRLDNFWKLLALVAAAVHWFNPAAWVLVALLGRDLEVSCDEWALRGLDDSERRAYALSLIAMAERPKGRSPVTCGFNRNPLEERIRFIMTNRKKSMFALTAATAMILCTTSAFATNAPVSAAEGESLKEGVYHVASENGDASLDNVFVTATKMDEEDAAMITAVAGDLEFFTVDEYAAYIEEQKVAMLAEIESGALSQETYDMTIRDMEEILEGIQDGSMMAAKPIETADGSTMEISLSTVDMANAEGFDVKYNVEDSDVVSIVFNDMEYQITPVPAE